MNNTNDSAVLKENLKRGFSNFPLASYIWSGVNYENNVKMHWHSDIELVRFISGEFTYMINMKEYRIRNGAIALIPANILHSFILPAFSSESAVVFNPHLLALSSIDETERKIMNALTSGMLKNFDPIYPSDPDYGLIDENLDFITKNSHSKKTSIHLRIKSKLLEILAIYYEKGYFENPEVSTDAGIQAKEERIKYLLNYIKENYTSAISIDFLSRELNVTKEYFCRFFKRNFGVSFIDYLNDYRLDKVVEELINSDEPVAKIGEDNGYQNSGYFFRVFKKKFGCTPSEFRHNLK